jgi:hypothetical protein
MTTLSVHIPVDVSVFTVEIFNSGPDHPSHFTDHFQTIREAREYIKRVLSDPHFPAGTEAELKTPSGQKIYFKAVDRREIVRDW